MYKAAASGRATFQHIFGLAKSFSLTFDFRHSTFDFAPLYILEGVNLKFIWKKMNYFDIFFQDGHSFQAQDRPHAGALGGPARRI